MNEIIKDDIETLEKDLKEVKLILHAMFRSTFPKDSNEDLADFAIRVIPVFKEVFEGRKELGDKIYTLMCAGVLYMEQLDSQELIDET